MLYIGGMYTYDREKFWGFGWFGSPPPFDYIELRHENGKYFYRFYRNYQVQFLGVPANELPRSFYFDGPKFDNKNVAKEWFLINFFGWQYFNWRMPA